MNEDLSGLIYFIFGFLVGMIYTLGMMYFGIWINLKMKKKEEKP
jgi:hypothetical protein